MTKRDDTETQLEVIRSVTVGLTSTLNLGEVLDNIVRLTAQATTAKGCALRLLDETTMKFELSASWGLSKAYLDKGPIVPDFSLPACMKGEIVQVMNVKEDPRVQYPEHAEAEGVASILSVPMSLREEIIGVLRLYMAEPRRITEGEMEFLRTLAGLGTLAIEHARLYSSLQADHASLVEDFHHWFETKTY